MIISVLGVAAGYALSRRTTPSRDFFDALAVAPMVLPPTVLDYYVLVTLGRNSAVGQAWEDVFGQTIVSTVTGAVVAAAIGSVPLVVKASARRSRRWTRRWWRRRARWREPVARVADGGAAARRARRDRRHHARLRPRARRLGVTLMVAGDIPGETQTASLAIYGAIQAGREDDASTMSLIIVVAAVSIVYAVNKRQSRSRR